MWVQSEAPGTRKTDLPNTHLLGRLLCTQETATETSLKMLWPRLWLCCQLSLPLAYVVTGHLELREKGPVQNRAVSPAVPRHIAREFYPITWPRALYCKHCLHLQCGAFYYTYWAWFPPRVTKSEAVLPRLRFQPQKIQREQESEAKKRVWIGGGQMGVELSVQTPGRQGI